MKSINKLRLKQMLGQRVLKFALFFTIIISLVSCKSNPDKGSISNDPLQNSSKNIESTKTLRDTLAEAETASQKSFENYSIAKEAYLKSSDDPDALIWYGRRTAYLGQYEEAINIYSKGIQNHPEDARMYRHRGHRYISLRQYDKAIKDFEIAVSLIEGQNDQIEPDGLPNSKNIPLSTLHGNIWYHLGLAYYLKNDMDNALRAFSNRTVTEKYQDNIVSGGHWQYMILRRMGKNTDADAAIRKVTMNMDIIENMSYYKMCLFYKQLITEQELVLEGANSSANDGLNYGLGNWYLYHKKDTIKAKKLYKYLLENWNKYSFAYLATESDWNRIFKN